MKKIKFVSKETIGFWKEFTLLPALLLTILVKFLLIPKIGNRLTADIVLTSLIFLGTYFVCRELTSRLVSKYKTRVEIIETHCEPFFNKTREVFWQAIEEVIKTKWADAGYSFVLADEWKFIEHIGDGIAETDGYSPSTHIQISILNPAYTEDILKIIGDPIVSERLESELKEGSNLVILYNRKTPHTKPK